jgi:cytokinesis protein
VKLIGGQRATNIEITLKRFKLSHAELKHAILSLDESVLDLEGTSLLMTCMPTSDELKIVQQFLQAKGKFTDVFKKVSKSTMIEKHLGIADRFVVLLMTIPHYEVRLKCQLFRLRFPALASKFLESLTTVEEALDKIKNSKSLKQVLKVVLSVGNYLNAGTHNGGAAGFRLATLEKLERTKSVNGKMTLLHFVIDYVEKANASKQPQEDAPAPVAATNGRRGSVVEALSYFYDMGVVKAASRIEWSELLKLRRELSSGVALLNSALVTDWAQTSLFTRTKKTQSGESTTEETTFAKCFEQFYANGDQLLTTVDEQVQRVLTSSQQIIRYFGEDPSRMDCTQFFQIFSHFMQRYESCEAKLRSQKEREARNKRIAAAKLVAATEKQDRAAAKAAAAAAAAAIAAVENKQPEQAASQPMTFASPSASPAKTQQQQQQQHQQKKSSSAALSISFVNEDDDEEDDDDDDDDDDLDFSGAVLMASPTPEGKLSASPSYSTAASDLENPNVLATANATLNTPVASPHNMKPISTSIGGKLLSVSSPPQRPVAISFEMP